MINSDQRGLTLIELIVVITLMMVLITLTTINITPVLPKANLATVSATLIADLKHQQLKAMEGATDGQSPAQAYGVHIQTNQYVLFTGSTYSVNDPLNRVILVPETTDLTTVFPNSILLFDRGSGNINGYTPGVDTITLTDDATNLTQTITLNRYGVVTSSD